MSTRTICDHCQKEIPIERGFALWRRDTEAKEADFCDLPCMLGYALTMAAKYGFANRVPPPQEPRP